jgi:uncharacterized OsmC-like protein
MEIAVDNAPGTVVARETGRGQYQQEVISGLHHLLADEPENVGGLDSDPGPYELLLAALGACTTMTLQLYADRNQIPLKRSQVRLRHARIYATDCSECETKAGMIDRIECVVTGRYPNGGGANRTTACVFSALTADRQATQGALPL